MSIHRPAFTGVPLRSPFRPFGQSCRRPNPSLTPRRVRSCPVSARSLDSYREGDRFGDPAPRRIKKRTPAESDSQKDEKRLPKTRVPLVSALCKLRLASVETCVFLVQSGCICVNGKVVKDAKAKIHRVEDTLAMNGKDLGTLAAFEAGTFPVYDETDKEMIPRVQRDFRNNPRNRRSPDDFKKYNRRVDRGFFSGRRFSSGK